MQKEPQIMTRAEQTAAKFEAGKQTALDDARRGVFHEPRATDVRAWADGYRSVGAELAASYGPNWAEKMKAT